MSSDPEHKNAVARWGRQVRRAAVAAGGVAELLPSGAKIWSDTAGPIDVDCRSLPLDAFVELHLVGLNNATFRLSGLHRNSTVHLRAFRPDNPSAVTELDDVRLELASTVEGRIVFRGGDAHLTVVHDPDHFPTPLIELEAGHLNVSHPSAPKGLPVISVRNDRSVGASLGYGTFRLRMNGGVSITSADVDCVALYVETRSRLTLETDHGRVDAISSVPGESLTVHVPLAADFKDPDVPVFLHVDSVKDVALTLDEDVVLSLRETAENVTVEGAGIVSLSSAAQVSNLGFPAEDVPTPTLRAVSNSIAVDLSGVVIFGDVAGATLAGHADSPVLIKGFDLTETDDPAAGSDITDFRVPKGLQGRATLEHMGSAYQLQPSLLRLPGWTYRFRPTWWPLLPAHPGLRHDVELMRKLRELCREKGADGRTRTRVGWCAQRLRHQATDTLTERLWLMLYRALGYGERPGPAFATWIFMSMVLALVIAAPGGWSFQPLAGIQLWLERAISPVGTIVGTGNGPEEAAWLYLARAVTAVPLVVGALALRNYVRTT